MAHCKHNLGLGTATLGAVSLGAVACFAIVACGGGGTQSPPPAEPRGQQQATPPEPRRTAAEAEDVRGVLEDLAAYNVCEMAVGSFMGLTGTAAEGETAPVVGRLWVKECESEMTEEGEVHVRLSGEGWKWLQERSQALGARLRVNEYLRFAAELEMTATVDVAYARDEHLLTLWASPVEPVRAQLRPTGNVEVNPQGPWGDVLGVAATALTGQSFSERAEQRVNQRGDRKLSQKLDDGLSVVVDLCTGQRYVSIGSLPEGELPPVSYPSVAPGWSANARVSLRPRGADVAGPWKTSAAEPLRVEVMAESEGAVEAMLVCLPEASDWAETFLGGGVPSTEEPIDRARVAVGQSAVLEAGDQTCDVALLTKPAGEEGAVFGMVARREGSRGEPMVGGCGPLEERRPVSDELRQALEEEGDQGGGNGGEDEAGSGDDGNGGANEAP